MELGGRDTRLPVSIRQWRSTDYLIGSERCRRWKLIGPESQESGCAHLEFLNHFLSILQYLSFGRNRVTWLPNSGAEFGGASWQAAQNIVLVLDGLQMPTRVKEVNEVRHGLVRACISPNPCAVWREAAPRSRLISAFRHYRFPERRMALGAERASSRSEVTPRAHG